MERDRSFFTLQYFPPLYRLHSFRKLVVFRGRTPCHLFRTNTSDVGVSHGRREYLLTILLEKNSHVILFCYFIVNKKIRERKRERIERVKCKTRVIFFVELFLFTKKEKKTVDIHQLSNATLSFLCLLCDISPPAGDNGHKKGRT